MSWDEKRSELRGGVFRADGTAVVAQLLGNEWPVHALQLVGDGFLVALDQGVPDASGLADTCVELLEDRDWDGDRELAVQLLARRGLTPTPLLKPLPVDLEMLAMTLEGDPVECGGRLDITSGEVWSLSAIEYARDEGEEDESSDDSARYLIIDGLGSRPGYRDMEDFIETIEDSGKADRLRRRRRVPRSRSAREWLTGEGYRPTLPSHL